MNTYRAGIDIGSTTVKLVVLDDNDNIIYGDYRRHQAHTQQTLADLLRERFHTCVNLGKDAQFDPALCEAAVTAQFGKSTQELGLAELPCVTLAAGALLLTLRDLQKNDLPHIRELELYVAGKFMQLDLAARRNLELTETMRSKEKKGSLLCHFLRCTNCLLDRGDRTAVLLDDEVTDRLVGSLLDRLEYEVHLAILTAQGDNYRTVYVRVCCITSHNIHRELLVGRNLRAAVLVVEGDCGFYLRSDDSGGIRSTYTCRKNQNLISDTHSAIWSSIA